MKKIMAAFGAALLMALSLAGCGSSKQDVSHRESVASEVKSSVGSMADEIGEGVTDAVSKAVSEFDRMAENGEVSDGDGIIGNEPTEEGVD